MQNLPSETRESLYSVLEINVFLDLSFSYENFHILYCHFVLISESNKNISMFWTISSTILKSMRIWCLSLHFLTKISLVSGNKNITVNN